ncbi:MAG: regulatory protein RecX [Firmicutes bacterium]|nr:regulatory protein RecX [Bacillota bacterium]
MTEKDERIRKARAQLFRYLAYRARTSSEAAAYLQRKGYTDRESMAVIKDLHEMGYLDDEAFTRDFISYRKSRGFGLRRIQHELINKGLEKKTVADILAEEVNEQEELQTISALLGKRVPEDGITDQRWLASQAAFLQRRGFRDRLIMKVLRAYGFGE